MPKKASCINLDQAAKLVLQVEYDVTNFSEFVNQLLWAYIDVNSVDDVQTYSRVHLINKAVLKVKTERAEQMKLVEDEISYEQKAREMETRQRETLMRRRVYSSKTRRCSNVAFQRWM